jgi:putative restriction endonuclease
MPAELFELLADAGFRLKARMVLITKYFSTEEQIALFESLGLQAREGRTESTSRVMEEAEDAAKRKGRCARFAVHVCSGYRYTCALTGYRCVTGDGATIVDAAHIEAWAATQNDDPTNGLALSKNAHWMFDAGLWSVDADLRIVVNTQAFTEHGPEAFRLGTFSGRHLQFDPSARLRPSAEGFRLHRRRFGFRL